MDISLFESYDVDNLEVTSMLFQTGYLTIKKRTIDKQGEKLYRLSYPNKEVRNILGCSLKESDYIFLK